MVREHLRYEKWIHQEEVLQREWRKWVDQPKLDSMDSTSFENLNSISSSGNTIHPV